MPPNPVRPPKRRPSIVVNQHLHDKMSYRKNKNIKPCIKSYKDSLRKMLVVFGTSLVYGFKNKELNKRLSNCTAYVNTFSDATARQL